MDVNDVWVSIIIPIIIGPILLVFKNIWDRYNILAHEKKTAQYNEKLTKIKDKLSKFYWPIYLKLIGIYQMNYNIPLDSDSESDNYSSATNSSSDDEPFIKFTKKKIKFCMCYTFENNIKIKCNRKIPYNNSSNICRKCRWKSLQSKIKLQEIQKPKKNIVEIKKKKKKPIFKIQELE